MPTPHRASPIPHTEVFDLYHLPPAFFSTALLRCSVSEE